MPTSAPDGVLRDGYDTGGFYDEAFEHGSDGRFPLVVSQGRGEVAG